MTAVGSNGGNRVAPRLDDATQPLLERPDCSTQLPEVRRTPSEPADGAKDEARRSIDALVSASMRYSKSSDYRELLDFIRRFRWYAPLNALFVHVQRPGSTFVAPAGRWEDKYLRRVLPEAQALLILQPFGPVMFVYDVGQTEPLIEDATTLPLEVIDPFVVRGSIHPPAVDGVVWQTIVNAVRDGVRVVDAPHGSQSAGWLSTGAGGVQAYQTRIKPEPVFVDVEARYNLSINEGQVGLTRYATLAHELAHLYCGHLGTPDEKWWPDRSHVDERTAEFEAESVSAMVIQRLDPSATFSPYLHQYLQREPNVPADVSLERVTTAAELIIAMGRNARMKVRIPGRRKNDRP